MNALNPDDKRPTATRDPPKDVDFTYTRNSWKVRDKGLSFYRSSFYTEESACHSSVLIDPQISDTIPVNKLQTHLRIHSLSPLVKRCDLLHHVLHEPPALSQRGYKKLRSTKTTSIHSNRPNPLASRFAPPTPTETDSCRSRRAQPTPMSARSPRESPPGARDRLSSGSPHNRGRVHKEPTLLSKSKREGESRPVPSRVVRRSASAARTGANLYTRTARNS